MDRTRPKKYKQLGEKLKFLFHGRHQRQEVINIKSKLFPTSEPKKETLSRIYKELLVL